MLKADYPTLQGLRQYQQEYDIIQFLAPSAGIIKVYHLERYQNKLVMCLEDFGGKSLKDWLEKYPFTLNELLTLAIQTTEILNQIHQNSVIHKDINPSNFIWNPNTKVLKLIDFGIATQLSRQHLTLKNPDILEGTLPYISPEQTGRMNRALDYRSDFYSLGVTFYQLFTRRLPFNNTDAMELVHCHIAKQPLSPHELNPEVPLAISNIIMKLIEKMSENRYQSARGIQTDLENCLNQWNTYHAIDTFSIARFDISSYFYIPQKLYGRDHETKTLLQAFERVVNLGTTEIMLVAGYSGVGKSALVYEIHVPMTEKRGYFAAGKFDQFQKNIPYYAITQAFNKFCAYLLMENTETLANWKTKILKAVGNNGQILIEIIPSLELVIGKQPSVTEVSSQEAQNRFNLLFLDFIKAICDNEHPLVLFIDDLQWVDHASLALLTTILLEVEIKYLLIIGAYRDNEVDSTHPFIKTIRNLQQAGIVINTIQLTNLQVADVNQLLQDTLKWEALHSQSLTEIIQQKTLGNAFFTHQFLQNLYEEKLLRFDFEGHQWVGDIASIKSQNITNNVVELMADKIKRLSKKTSMVLQLAACIGNQFDLFILAIIYDQDKNETLSALWEAIVEGLILPSDENYKYLDTDKKANFKFLHDRVQQAAYSLISEDNRRPIHLKIGRLLLANTSKPQLDEHIFDIVNHFNQGIELISEFNDKIKIAKLNLMAGKKARESTAYNSAFDYFNNSIKNLEHEGEIWKTQYDLMLALHIGAVETASISGDIENLERLFQVVIQQAQAVIDKIAVYQSKVQSQIVRGRQQDAVNTSLEILELLGEKLPAYPTPLDIQRGLEDTKAHYADKPIELLMNLPDMTDTHKIAIMRILAQTLPAAYITRPELFSLITFKAVDLSIRYGNVPESAFMYACYGVILCGVGIGDLEYGYRFGQLALGVLDKLQANKLKSRILEVVSGHIWPFKKHLKETLPSSEMGYQSGRETGDLEFAGVNAFFYSCHAYYAGLELSQLESEMAAYNDSLIQIKAESARRLQAPFWQAVLNLLGQSENPCWLIGKGYDQKKMLPILQQTENKTAIASLYLNTLILCYLFDEYEPAFENALLVKENQDGLMAMYAVTVYFFYESLTRLILYDSVTNEEKNSFLKKVIANQSEIKNWADHAPMNNLHKWHLVEAEYHRVLEHDMDMILEHYEQAIRLAKSHEYIQEEALANELLAKFWLKKGQDQYVKVHLLEARYLYQQWGAIAKVTDLEKKYPQFLLQRTSSSIQTDTTISLTRITSTSTQNSPNWLDLNSVIKASQTLSREMRLNHLLKTIIQIIIENAGAEQGCLLSEQAGSWIIEASEVDNKAIQVATTMVNYVARTQEAIVLNNAAKEGQFIQDPYIVSHQPKSILCVPLINQNKLVGIIYLENNLAVGAFTPERIETVQLLGAQAAISLENARLYENLAEYNRTLETKVEERTQELSKTLEHLKATQQELIQSEKMAALGQLIAGIAHEINTPLGAIQASINNITEALNDSIRQLPQLLRELSTEQQDLFFAFIRKAFQPKTPLTSREERQLKRALIKELEEQDFENTDDIADTLVDMGIYQDIEPFIPLLTATNSELILQVAYALATQQTNSQNIETAIERASKIIFALKSYARYDHSGQAVKANLIEGLNVVLTLYHNQLKQGVELITNYQEVPEILCYPDELNQVWTNLIHNAIQAMNNRGQLDIVVFSQAEQIVVQITDSGVGIPDEIKDRIFEPFFTTKGAGEGSGLGLDIVKKIIDKHQGNIIVESQPGQTTFSVFLPMTIT